MLPFHHFYSSLCFYFLFLNVNCWRTLKYQKLTRNSLVSDIPDPKWHFFGICEIIPMRFSAILTPSAPVLRYCTTWEPYYIYIAKGQPRFELLIIMHHANGEQLVNLTFDSENVYFNNIFVKTEFWTDGAELFIEREEQGFAFFSPVQGQDALSIGNGHWDKPEHEWLSLTLDGQQCWEVKAKVVVGYVKFTLYRDTGFPIEPYDDILFETTTTTTTTTTTAATSTAKTSKKAENHQNNEKDQHSAVKKASTMLGLIYAVCGILVLIAAALLFFLGFRLGRCFAKKQALKKGLLKSGIRESNASEPASDTCAASTPDASTNQPKYANASTMDPIGNASPKPLVRPQKL